MTETAPTATAASLVERIVRADGFPPSEGTALLEELRREALETRQAEFAALMLRAGLQPNESTARAAAAALEAFMALPRERRMLVVGDPAFFIWLQRASRLERRAELSPDQRLAYALKTVGAVLERCVARLDEDGLGLDLPVPVVRYQVDPLVGAVAPPTYVFPSAVATSRLEEQTAYALETFESVARAALTRIGAAWPELRLMFPLYVRTVVHLPFADFRSASAARYTGLIFLTADDRTILEVEESLVHEWGHQLLYTLMELDPVVVGGTEGDLTLPWSGARRDFYGYFHALFVYTLLLRYLERIDDRGPEETARVRDLFGHILRGAVRALPDFDDESRFTPYGRELYLLLEEAIRSRAATHADLLKGGDDDAGAGAGRV